MCSRDTLPCYWTCCKCCRQFPSSVRVAGWTYDNRPVCRTCFDRIETPSGIRGGQGRSGEQIDAELTEFGYFVLAALAALIMFFAVKGC